MTADEEKQLHHEIVSKLLEKTRAGRIHWEPSLVEQDVFRTQLEDGFSFEISSVPADVGESYVLAMKDNGGNEILRAIGRYNFRNQSQDKSYPLLLELYQRARKLALDIDNKLDRVSSLLDKI